MSEYITYYPHPDLDTLPRAFKKRWIAALQTSKKAKGLLCSPGGMCCLGVACHIQGISKEEMDGVTVPNMLGVTNKKLEPKKVPIGKVAGKIVNFTEWTGWAAFIIDSDGRTTIFKSFASLNDNDDLTHKQIATLISGKILKLRVKK